MIIYYAALAASALLAIWMTETKKDAVACCPENRKLQKTALSMIPLFLVALFRWNVGVDVVYGTGYYYQEYMAIQEGLGNIHGYEVGFYALMELCNFLNLNLYQFYCVVTCLFFWFVTKYIAENSESIAISIVLFVVSDLYLFSFSTLRQALAIAFFLYTAAEILRGKNVIRNWKCWVSTAAAISMHTSIAYLLLVMLAAKIRIKKKTLLTAVILGCVLSPVIRVAVRWLMSFTVYFNKYEGTKEFLTEFTPTYFLIALIIFIPAYLYYDRLIEEKRSNYILINIAAAIVVLMLNSSVLVMPYRIFPLFVPVYLILCPAIYRCRKGRDIKQAALLCWLIFPFLAMFINQYYRNGGYALFVYDHIFRNLEQIK